MDEVNNRLKYALTILILFIIASFWVLSTVKKNIDGRLSGIEKNQKEIIDLMKKSSSGKTGSSATSVQDDARIRAELAELQNKVDNQQSIFGIAQASPSASPSPSVSPALKKSYISLDGKFTRVDVYEKPLASSKIVGQAVSGKYYRVLDKSGTYYKIELSDILNGYISSQFVKEL